MEIKSVIPELDAKIIIERGFILKKESEAVDLSKFAKKVNLRSEDGESEGIWVVLLTDQDTKLYESDSSRNESITAVLLNHALMYYPNKTWGRVITGKTNGSERPIFNREEQIQRFIETHEAYEEEFASVKG